MNRQISIDEGDARQVVEKSKLVYIGIFGGKLQ
jgi:hypothetical protein